MSSLIPSPPSKALPVRLGTAHRTAVVVEILMQVRWWKQAGAEVAWHERLEAVNSCLRVCSGFNMVVNRVRFLIHILVVCEGVR